MFYFVFTFNKNKNCHRKFYCILKSLQAKELETYVALEQLRVEYEQLCQHTRCSFRLIELLNFVLYRLDSRRTYVYATRKEDELENSKIREFVVKLIKLINTEDPFSNLPEKEAMLLKGISHSIDNNNLSSAKETLFQLCLELQSDEKLLLKERTKSTIATFLSICSIILTVIFGILSIILK